MLHEKQILETKENITKNTHTEKLKNSIGLLKSFYNLGSETYKKDHEIFNLIRIQELVKFITELKLTHNNKGMVNFLEQWESELEKGDDEMKKIDVENFRKEIETEDKEQLLKDLETCKAIYTLHKNVANLGFDMKQLVSNDKLVARLKRFENAKIDVNEILDILTDWICDLLKSEDPDPILTGIVTEPVDLEVLNKEDFNLQDLEVCTPQVNPEIKYLFDRGVDYFKKLGEDIINNAFLNAANSYIPIYPGLGSPYYFRNLYEAISNNFTLEKFDITHNDDMSILSLRTPESNEYVEIIDSYYTDELNGPGIEIPKSGYARITQYLDKNNKYLPYRVVYTTNVKLYKDQRATVLKIVYYNNQIDNKMMHSHDYRNWGNSFFPTKIRFTDYRDENFDAIEYHLDRNVVSHIQYIKDNTVQIQILKSDNNYKIGIYNENNEDEKDSKIDWMDPATLLKMYNTVFGKDGIKDKCEKAIENQEETKKS